MIEVIQAIASLFPLVASLVVLILGLIYRKPLTNFLFNLSKLIFKKGDTELSVETVEKITTSTEIVEETVRVAISSDAPQKNPQEISKPNDSNWFMKMWEALNKREMSEAEEAYKMLQASVIDAKEKLSNEIFYQYLRFTKANERSAISELEKIAEKSEARSLALFWLSECYKFENAFEKAKTTLKLSLEAAATEEEKAYRANAMVDLLLKMEGPVNEAFDILSDIMRTISKENQARIYRAYAEIYKKTENKLLRAISLEKAIEIDSSDNSLLFQAAYAQSEAGLPALAITNYEAQLRQNPDDASTLNNLGAEFNGLGMSIQSVRYYTKSAEGHETLAMSNLAYKFIEVGFITEAESILRKAQEEKSVHPNVLDAMASIAKRKKSEDEKKSEIDKIGIRQKTFFKNFAEARFNIPYKEGVFNGTWKFGSETIKIEEKDKIIVAEWGKAPNKRRLKGEIEDRSANFVFENQIAWMTSQESFTVTSNGLCYLDLDRKVIHLMTLSKEKPEFMEFILENE